MTMIRTRFAPSPTGELHIGGVRTAIFNWLWAKKNGGEVYLRIEDTDKNRSKEEYTKSIIEGLSWLGINFDGDVVIQSLRIKRHQEVAESLLNQGAAYYCDLPPEELLQFKESEKGKFINPNRDKNLSKSNYTVLRLKVHKSGSTSFDDIVLGDIQVSNDEIDDMVLLRANGSPTYLLSCVVDDYDMGITDVIRGTDHLTNTFRQMQIYNALSWKAPKHAHIPLIMSDKGSKLSKRDPNVLSLQNYRKEGYLNSAIFNYLLRLGWGYQDKEIISVDEALKYFSLDKVIKSPAKFDIMKMNHINQEYIKNLTDDQLMQLLQQEFDTEKFKDLDILKNSISLAKTRGETLKKVLIIANLFINKANPIDEKSKEILSKEQNLLLLKDLIDVVNAIADFSAEGLKEAFYNFAKSKGLKPQEIMKLLRASVFGSFESPPIFQSLAILSKDEILRRLEDATL